MAGEPIAWMVEVLHTSMVAVIGVTLTGRKLWSLKRLSLTVVTQQACARVAIQHSLGCG